MKPGFLRTTLLLPALLLALSVCKPEESSDNAQEGGFDTTAPKNRPEPARFGARQEARFSPEAWDLVEKARGAGGAAYADPAAEANRWNGFFDGSASASAFGGGGADVSKIGAMMNRQGVSSSIVDTVLSESRSQGADPLLVLSVMKQESQFDPRAHSPVGARGLMQVMPDTGRDLGVRNPANLYDPKTNIRAGVRYLKGMFDEFSSVSMSQLATVNPFADNGVKAAIAAYNAGPGAVKKHQGVPPFRETRDYVVKVLNNYADYRRRLNSV